jgi:hypothetical protein
MGARGKFGRPGFVPPRPATDLRLLGKIAVATAAILITAFGAAGADVAVIVNSGSTNTPGFRIAVEQSGNAEYTAAPRRVIRNSGQPAPTQLQLPDTLVKRLYTDLDAAKPFSSLPTQRCAKSASFGTTLTIALGFQETPDLSCGGGDSEKLKALLRDANEIVKLFNSR